MKRIRIGNDFVYLWSIERGGEPENLDAALEKKLLIKVFKTPKSIPFTTTGNVIRVELTPSICSIVGTYNLEFSYKLPDMSLSDDERTCTVDIDAFQIVGKSAQADEVEEITSTSDVAIGLNGKDAFEVWLEDNPGGTKEDYYNWLQKPATDAVSLIDDKIEHLDEIIDSSTENESERVGAENIRLSNEAGRVNAESQRVDNEDERLANEINREQAENLRAIAEGSRVDAENIRVSNENTRKSNETGRVSAEIDRVNTESIRTSNENTRLSNEVDRVNAESDRVIAEGLRQSSTQQAISNAESATENANTAAQNADDARENIMPSVLNNEEVQADVYAQLNARITALEAILSNKIKDRIDVTKEFNVWGKTNLILYGDGASTKTPDFIGQTYIDTTNRNVYIAVGVSSAGNWKLV